MIPEGTENHIADTKADNDSSELPENMKADNDKIRDDLAEKEGSPYHETGPARVMAFKNGWNACLANEPLGKLIKSWGQLIVEKEEYKEECERLAKLVVFWQTKYNEQNSGWQPPKIDNL